VDKTFFPITGIEALFIAEDVQDSAASYQAGAPAEFAPAESGEWGEEQGSKELYYNNVLQDIYYGIKKSTITVKISGISAEKDAAIRGVYYDATTGRAISTGNEEPPYCALGMKINKGRGDYIFIWFPKGKFSGGKITAETKTGDVSVQTLEYTFSALATDKQFTVGGKTAGVTWVKGDTTDSTFDGSAWFSEVQVPDEPAA